MDVGATDERRRLTPHVQNGAAVGGHGETQIQTQVTRADRGSIQRHLDSAVSSLADVHEGEPRKAARWAVRQRQNRVLDVLVVESECEPDPLFEETRIEAELGLLADLRLQVGIPDVLRRDPTYAPGSHRRRVGANGGEDVRLLAGPPPGAPELELREDLRVRQEGLLRRHPGETELGVVGSVEILPEGAIPVGAERPGEEQAVFPGQQFLAIEPEGLVLRVVLTGW